MLLTARGDLQQTIANLGGIVPLLWDHSAMDIGWKLRIDPVDHGRDSEKDALTYEFSLHQIGGSGYEVAKDDLGNYYKFSRGEERSPYWIFHRDLRGAYIFDQQHSKLVRIEEESSDDPGGFDPNESLLPQVADMRNRIPVAIRRSIEGWQIYHDVHVEEGSAIRKPATTQFTKRLASDSANLVTVLHTLYTNHRDFKVQIDEGMKAGFGPEFDGLVFQPAASQQIQLAVQWKSSSQAHAGSDLSDGTLRFLFLLTVLANPEPASLIAIDEPETGLHPSMLPIIAEYANEASERTQVILTTHSPGFLDAFSNFSPTVTVCHWEAGESSLHVLSPPAYANWLERYRLGELFSRGDFESLILSPVDSDIGLAERVAQLPPEQA